jgi:hypothetical protein
LPARDRTSESSRGLGQRVPKNLGRKFRSIRRLFKVDDKNDDKDRNKNNTEEKNEGKNQWAQKINQTNFI